MGAQHPVLLALGLVAALAVGQEPTPAEQYKALLDEASHGPSAGAPMSDAERVVFIGRAYRHRQSVEEKFLALAQKYPADPIALDALVQSVWQVNGTFWPVELVGEDTTRAKALEIIRKEHLQSDKLGPLCVRVSYGFAEEYETFLRAAAAQSPHAAVQAAASLSLGHFLGARLDRIEILREQPERAAEFAGLFGKAYLEGLLRQDRGQATKEIEGILEEVQAKYAEVKLPGGESAGRRAGAELFGIRHLSVGNEAPEIEGPDQDGQRFKLSDYRGKVVLLDFWSYV